MKLKLNPVSAAAYFNYAEILKFQTKQLEQQMTQEKQRIERMRVKRLQSLDPTKGIHVDTLA